LLKVAALCRSERSTADESDHEPFAESRRYLLPDSDHEPEEP
jgi:hypothetical protein